jgi:hypothetical protein
METYRDYRYLRKVTKYGGLIEDYGHAYMDIIDNHYIIIRCELESIEKLGTIETQFTFISFDMNNNIPKSYHDAIIYNFKNSFGSRFGSLYAENFANYDIFKKNALSFLTGIKDNIQESKSKIK